MKKYSIDKDFNFTDSFQQQTIIMVDEAQFLTQKQVRELYEISLKYTVVCFGLKTDFRQCFFEGSKALFELADDIMELKTICECGKKANSNNADRKSTRLHSSHDQIPYAVFCLQKLY